MSNSDSNNGKPNKKCFKVDGGYVTAYANATMRIWADTEEEAIEIYEEEFMNGWALEWDGSFTEAEEGPLERKSHPRRNIEWSYSYWEIDEYSLENVEAE